MTGSGFILSEMDYSCAIWGTYLPVNLCTYTSTTMKSPVNPAGITTHAKQVMWRNCCRLQFWKAEVTWPDFPRSSQSAQISCWIQRSCMFSVLQNISLCQIHITEWCHAALKNKHFFPCPLFLSHFNSLFFFFPPLDFIHSFFFVWAKERECIGFN